MLLFFIKIPWTRITSEPVVVTINTLEFVAKLKDSNLKTSEASPTSSFDTLNTDNQTSSQKQQQQQQQQQVPAGYIQSIISKVLFNMCIIVNNVIVKFVEDDIVLSFNMKSAECFTVNDLWEKAFIDVNSQNLHLRKILQLNDVTICLDKLDNKKNSRINFYQEPLIYRCSIQSRLDFEYYPNNGNLTAFNQQLKLIKMNFYCRKFDVSITDHQLPMFLRLVELVLAIVDGSLKLPQSQTESNEIDGQQSQNSQRTPSPVEKSTFTNLNEETDVKSETKPSSDELANKGWMSWAWSYVPSVSNILFEDGNEPIQEAIEIDRQIQILIGFYFDELNVSFKVDTV